LSVRHIRNDRSRDRSSHHRCKVTVHSPQNYTTMKKYNLALPLSIFLVATISGCGMKQEVTDTRNSGIATLDQAIQKMGSQSDGWKDVLQETRDKLIKEGQSTLANEVSSVISRATSDVGIEGRCSVDFVRDRSKEELKKLRATLTKEKLELKPVFCKPTPSSIDMNLSSERRNLIEISGYNFKKEDIKVWLLTNETTNAGAWSGKDQKKVDVSSHLGRSSDYLLTLNLGSNGVVLTPDSQKIIFELPNTNEYEVVMRQPDAPPPKPQYLNRRVSITGTVDMHDDETGPNEDKTVTINTPPINVSSSQGGTYSWQDCVGGEVRGEYRADFQLDKDTGVVTVLGLGKYFEGTSCNTTDLEGTTQPLNFSLIPGGKPHVHSEKLSDDDGHVIFNLTFKNVE
jgi:hypothetical protein